MAAGDVYKWTAVFTNADTGEEMTTGGHITEAPALGAPSLSAVGDAVKNWWNVDQADGTRMKAFVGVNIALSAVELRRVAPVSPLIEVYTTGLPIAGTEVSLSLSPNDAILVNLRTALVGKSYRGRAYLPPPTGGSLSGPGALTAAAATSIADQYQELLRSLVNISSVDLAVVYSKKLNVATAITSVRVDRRLRSQRRRTAEAPLYVSAD